MPIQALQVAVETLGWMNKRVVVRQQRLRQVVNFPDDHPHEEILFLVEISWP